MKMVSILLTFILSAQLVYASATVCEHYGKCGSKQVESQVDNMADCPHHKKAENNQDKKKETQPEKSCKCCAVITYEEEVSARPTLQSLISFIQFTEDVQQVKNHSSVSFRPPIS